MQAMRAYLDSANEADQTLPAVLVTSATPDRPRGAGAAVVSCFCGRETKIVERRLELVDVEECEVGHRPEPRRPVILVVNDKEVELRSAEGAAGVRQP